MSCANALEPQEIPLEHRVEEMISSGIEVKPGRNFYLEAVGPARPDMPTFLFMPGANRAGYTSDIAPQTLIAQGFGVAELSFSVHPLAINTLVEGVAPSFRIGQTTLADFAAETEMAAEIIRQRYHVRNIIPVSLSYSGAVTPLLKNFPLVIETSPMTAIAAENPVADQFRRILKKAQLLNPISGSWLTRATLDEAYRKNWTEYVGKITADLDLQPSRTKDFTEGYAALCRAAEGCAWKIDQLGGETRHVFVLGGEEAPVLYTHQLETFKQYSLRDPRALLVVIKGASHVVPMAAPGIYAYVLNALTMTEMGQKTGVVYIEPPAGDVGGKLFEFTGSKAVEWIDGQIKAAAGKDL